MLCIKHKKIAMRWANEQGFLMKQLQALTPDPVHLSCLSEVWAAADDWEQYRLGLYPLTRVFRREIVMNAGARCCWYAKTVIPETTYMKEYALFTQLDHRPLGALIWSHPTVSRTELVTYEINPQDQEYSFIPFAKRFQEATLQARYSVILFDSLFPLYLLEIFLPDLYMDFNVL